MNNSLHVQGDGNKGWKTCLFVNPDFVCAICDGVCVDPVELSCKDYQHNDGVLYCEQCIQLFLKKNNKCPSNKHDTATSFNKIQYIQIKIMKLAVFCPNSIEYKLNVKHKNNANEIIDTNEEKEGKNENKTGCKFKGTLSDLLSVHISKCFKNYIPKQSQIIIIQNLQKQVLNQNDTIKKLEHNISDINMQLNTLQTENKQQNEKIVILESNYNKLNDDMLQIIKEHKEEQKELKDSFPNGQIFNYKAKQHGNSYHIFGKTQIKRKIINEFKWKIKLSASFQGRIGIIEDTNNALQGLKQGVTIHGNKNVAIVGSSHGGLHGTFFGSDLDDLKQFIHKDDTITISINYQQNTISFRSEKRNMENVRKLKDGIESVRFIADIYYSDSTMTIL